MMTREELASVRTVDLITYGRRTGLPRRVEIWWFHVEDRFIITGTPGQRDWLANIRSNARVVIGVNGTEIEATAREVVDPQLRKLVFSHRETRWYSTQSELQRLIDRAPMVEILLSHLAEPEPLDFGSRVELI